MALVTSLTELPGVDIVTQVAGLTCLEAGRSPAIGVAFQAGYLRVESHQRRAGLSVVEAGLLPACRSVTRVTIPAEFAPVDSIVLVAGRAIPWWVAGRPGSMAFLAGCLSVQSRERPRGRGVIKVGL